MNFPIVSAAVLGLALSAFSPQAADWAQWRGPERTGHAPADWPVPTTLPAEPKIVWKIKVGEGFSSPIIAQGRLFHMDNVDGKEVLHAVTANDGKELWQVPIDDVFKDGQGPPGPRCTPLVDGDRIYAQSCKGELQCLNTADGKLLWRVNYTNDFEAIFIGEKGNVPGAARHGNNGSPLIVGNHLYALAGGTNGAGVVCLDKMTGKVVWKSQSDQAAYAPPVIAEIAGVRQIVCFVVEGVIGLKADDGKLLWRVPIKTAYARHVTTPVIHGDMVIVASHQVGLMGIRISKDGEGQKADTAWTSKEAAMNFSSPVAVGDHLYGLGPNKDLVCVELATGKTAWSAQGYITTSADKAHVGMLVLGKNILTLTDGGELVLFAADPTACKELGRVQVSGINWCNPAYADGRLYLRDGIKGAGDLLCVELVAK